MLRSIAAALTLLFSTSPPPPRTPTPEDERWKTWTAHMLDLFDVEAQVSGDSDICNVAIEHDVDGERWRGLVESFRECWTGSGDLRITAPGREVVM